MSQSYHGPSSNGHVASDRRTVDWSGYPALFQRVAPVTDRTPRRSTEFAESFEAAFGTTGGVREAMLGYCQASLFPTAATYRAERLVDASAGRVLAAAEAFGLTRDEVRRLGCGIYVGPAAVREHLRGVGFGEAEIDAAGLTCDETGRPRAELAGCFVVPLTDDAGRLCDFLFLTVGEPGRGFAGYRYLYGPAKSNVAAFGLRTVLSRPTGRRSLVLVDDVLDALLLQCRGVENVAAVGGPGQDLTPRRWEELARIGVAAVTLAFRRDDRYAASVRDALVGALRARTAPEVFVANPYPAGERSAADVLRRFGRDACGLALEARSLAFHDKDFGAVPRARAVAEPVEAWIAPIPASQPAPPAAPHHRAAFRKHLADLTAALPYRERAAAEGTIDAVGLALEVGDYARAAWLSEGGVVQATPAPAEWFWSTSAGGYAVPRPHAWPVVAASPAFPVQPSPWSVPTWPVGPVVAGHPLSQIEAGRAVLGTLRDWVRREREVAAS